MIKTPRVVVRDDEDTIRLAIEIALEERGRDITSVATGSEAALAATRALRRHHLGQESARF